ncbi:MAG TPA: glycosyl hydrolase family 8 [Oculatellaceae cyanobacterium]|jgi:endo-1,4-beta-D-glucanase Y
MRLARFWVVLLLGFCLLLAQVVEAAPLTRKALAPLLKASWEQYKQTFIQNDGRVIDYNGNVTTSEGQSYAMLRAFWMRDKETFDKTYRWTKDNLQIPRGDHLFSWKWGQLPDGTWGTLDKTSASDADQDIALALILAHHVWKEPAYLEDAKLILADIWERLTAPMPVGRVLLPGDWPQQGRSFQINPSYFAPYAYRVFAEVDEEHDWREVLDSSYEILARSVAQTGTHLPPDWVQLSLDNDAITLYTNAQDTRSDFGYEAIRVYWRVGLDRLVQPLDKRSASVLHARNPLLRYWQVRSDLPISLTYDGIVRHPQMQSGAVYGAVLPGLYAQDEHAADVLVARRVLPNLKPGGQWNTKNDYYAQNWLWFGLALYANYGEAWEWSRLNSMTSRLSQLMELPVAK